MRVVAGTLKGRRVTAVKGENTRPTSDKIKESIFNMIGPYFDGGLVLDLYSGSGNLGIEALSRGIEKGIFVDKEHDAVRTIRKNVEALGLERRVEIYRNDAFKALKALVKRELQFDLILLDPPYKGQQINAIIEFVSEHHLLIAGGVVMAECLKADELYESIGDIKQIRREIYGITAISIYKKERDEADEKSRNVSWNI